MPCKYTIKEYESFTRNIECSYDGFYALPEKTFDNLLKIILDNKDSNYAIEVLSISVKKNIGTVISARNYVGVICMKDGTIIEILPKIYSRAAENEMTAKTIFLKMLKSVKELPFRNSGLSSLSIGKMDILEVFIQMFINEVNRLIKCGIKSDYKKNQDNEGFLKGKLIISKHITNNVIRKDKFFVEYDVFSVDRAENRLIKSTLHMLEKITKNPKNKKDLMIVSSFFDSVNVSHDFEKDFSKCNITRNMKEYKKVLDWCKVFLSKQSFMTFAGSNIAYALLFPMEKLFENYIAQEIKKYYQRGDFIIKTQNKMYHLFEEPKKMFLIKPDIVIWNQQGNTIILDTKWKKLNSKKQNYGISQSDIYQMYAYGKKYRAKKVILIYPKSNLIEKENTGIHLDSGDGVNIEIFFVDLCHMDGSLFRLNSIIKSESDK